MQHAAPGGRNPWKLFDRRKQDSAAPITCLCIPYAGGGSSVFSQWVRPLAGHMDVIPAHLPGRGKRFLEAPYVEFDELLDDLELAALPCVEKEFVLFGHSLGALLAYELAYRLHSRHMRNALHVFISATRAPNSPQPASAVIKDDDHALSDADFLQKLATLGGFAPEVQSDPELTQLTLPAVRADFRVYASYTPPPDPQQRCLPCPITAFGGLDDLRDVPEETLRGWSKYTRSRFALRLFPGDHFFLQPHRESIIKHMLHELEHRPEMQPLADTHSQRNCTAWPNA